MAGIRDIILGLKIFEKHDGSSCDAQHDILYASQGSGKSISASEREELLNHGWFISEDSCTCTYSDRTSDEEGNEETSPEHDLSCCGWAIFT